MIEEELEDEGLDHLVTDMGKILEASSQLMKWVEEIIALSQIESGRSQLDHQLFSVTELMDELVQKVSPDAEESGNTDRGSIEFTR